MDAAAVVGGLRVLGERSSSLLANAAASRYCTCPLWQPEAYTLENRTLDRPIMCLTKPDTTHGRSSNLPETPVLQFVNAGGGYCTSTQHQDDLLFFIRAGYAKPSPLGTPNSTTNPQQQQHQHQHPPAQRQQQQPTNHHHHQQPPPNHHHHHHQQQQPGSQAKAPVDPFFVRRRTAQLPEELRLSGAGFSTVDWAATVLLNLVLHSHYQLTVVACG